MSTKPPEPSPAQIDQWWAETLDVHAVNPRPAFMQLARLAYAAGWEARAAEPVAGEPSDEELLEIRDGAYCPSNDEINDEDDSSWQYTSDYIRWLDEDGTPQEQEAYAAKGLRAVFEAGRRWDRPAPHAEGEVGELVGKLGWIAAQCADIGWPDDSITVDRAAALLERQAASPAPPAEGDAGELVEELRGLAEYFSGEMYSSEWIDQLTRAADLLKRQAAELERLPELMEALRRLRKWGCLLGEGGFSTDVVVSIIDWIDAGMSGPLPSLPDYLVDRQPLPSEEITNG